LSSFNLCKGIHGKDHLAIVKVMIQCYHHNI